jgi:hypothetical protein
MTDPVPADRRLALGLALALAMAGALAIGPARAQDISVDAPALNPGDSFRFSEGDRIYLVRDIGWEGDLFVSSVDYESGESYRDYYMPDLNMVRSEEVGSPETFFFEPHSMKYKFPMRVGLRWSGSFETIVRMTSGFVTQQYTTTQQCEVTCIERIEVPAGEFESFRIDCAVRHSDQVFEEIRQYWYAPEAGVSVVSESRRHDMPSLVDRVELIALERADRQPFHALPEGVTSTCEFQAVSR